MTQHGAWLAMLATACTATSPSASAAPATAPQPTAPPATSSVPPPAGGLAEVTPTNDKTSTGGDVTAVGVPRFQLVDPDGVVPLIFRTGRGSIFADDAHSVSIWDAATGAPLRQIAPRLDASPAIFTSLAVSSDGEWLATGSSHVVRVFRAPFDKPAGELACYQAHVFSHGGKLLACSTNGLGVWDLAQRKLVAPLPAATPKSAVNAIAFSPDDHSLVWTSDNAVFRWDFAAAAAVTALYQAPAHIEYSALASGGSAAYVRAAGKAVVIDLASGKSTPAPAKFGAALSPSGKRLAFAASGVQVIEVATGKTLWTAKVTSPVTRLAFGETDDAIAYAEAGQLRVAVIPAAPATSAPTTRFVGWLGAGTAALERGDTLRSFTLATRAWGAADRAALEDKPLDHAPPWARWVARADGGWDTAAEPSKRHDLSPERRGVEPCSSKLRVWTQAGGTKTLTMSCTKPELEGHEDPGWELGGGWAVGVTATTASIFEPRTGRRAGVIEVPRRKNKHPELAPAYWQMALAPAGDLLALIWRRAELDGAHGSESPDPREDAMHLDEATVNADCVSGEHGCQLEYFLEIWNVKGTARRIFQARLERALPGRSTPEPATPSGSLAFDPTGAHLFVGFDDGEIRVISLAARDSSRVEHLHRAPVRKLSIDPSGGWAFSADAAGEQRLWHLIP